MSAATKELSKRMADKEKAKKEFVFDSSMLEKKVIGAYMSTMKSEKIEDLVKDAIRKEMEKRKPSALVEELMEKAEIKKEEPKVEEPVVKEKKIVLKSNQVELKTLIKDTAHNVAITTFKFEDWDEAIRDFIPQVDPSYVIDPVLATNILSAWEADEKILVYGPTGAGKSSLVEQLCGLVGRPFVRINCTGDMDSSMIFGQLTAKDGSTHWVDGVVTEAVRYGAVLGWDEWDVTPPEIAMGLQWLLEDKGKLFLKEMPGTTKDKQIIPHKEFRVCAIGNTQGQGDETGAHAGTNVQNSATLDRFGTCLYVDYLDAKTEIQMVRNKYPSIAATLASQLVKLAGLIRQGHMSNQLTLTTSPRALFNICKKVESGYKVKESFKLVYVNKLSLLQQKVATELFIKIFGTRED